MRNNRLSRWFAAAITGTLFAILMLALTAPVAADGGGLVTTLPGQDANSNIIVVSSPGYINNGTAVNPINGTTINGTTISGTTVCTDPSCGAVCTANACYPAGTVCTVNGCGIPINGGGCTIYGCVGGTCAVNGCVTTVNGTCSVYGCGTLGYTAAGPIVGVDPNGNPIVYDVRGGGYDTYTRAPNGQLCEADSTGACEKGSPGT